FGNTIDGCQAEFVRVPDAMANLAPIPDGLSDEQVLMCPDIMSTGFVAAERGEVQIGDVVAVFAQGPIGLCATAGAKLRGASTVIAGETVPERIEMSKRMGAGVVIDFKKTDPVDGVQRGRGADVAAETPHPLLMLVSSPLVLRRTWLFLNLCRYSTVLALPLGPFDAVFGYRKIVMSLCPSGKECMRRIMLVVATGAI